MPTIAFEATKALLKAHPNARPVTPRGKRRPSQHDPATSPTPDPDRHQRKCRICRHPDRLEIEQEFLHWRSSAEIAEAYGLPDHSSVCRHARALGLYNQRGERICFALVPILEQSERVFARLTPNMLISAVRTYAQINDKGKRIRPTVHRHYITPTEYQELLASSVQAPSPRSNRPIQKLEGASTP
jgi:hypothetical protein